MSGEDVVVIGAGAAGIAAGLVLRAHGRRVTVIEARDGIGGRAWTRELPGGHLFDAGASFLHAVDRGNPWVDLALARGVELRRDPRRRVSPTIDLRDLCIGIASLPTWAAAAVPSADLATAVPSTAPARPEVLRFAGQWLCGVDAEKVDAGDFAATGDGEDWLTPNGYGTLVGSMAAALPVTLATPVRAVGPRPRGVTVRTDRGAIRAAGAIVTVPLGVLAARGVDLPLTDRHREAVAVLPMGRLVKVAVGLDGDPFGQGDDWYLHGALAGEHGVLHAVRQHGLPLSIGFIGGGAAHALDTAEALGEAARASLVHAFGSRVGRSLGRVEVADWWHDPWARGSYAVARPGGAWARAVLREPLSERILYAGEASAAEGWAGTVAGAWREGCRAARAMLDILQQSGD